MAVRILPDPSDESFDELEADEDPIHSEPDRLSTELDSEPDINVFEFSEMADLLSSSIRGLDPVVSLGAGAPPAVSFSDKEGCSSALVTPASLGFVLFASSSKTFFGRGGTSRVGGGIKAASSACCGLSP